MNLRIEDNLSYVFMKIFFQTEDNFPNVPSFFSKTSKLFFLFSGDQDAALSFSTSRKTLKSKFPQDFFDSNTEQPTKKAKKAHQNKRKSQK